MCAIKTKSVYDPVEKSDGERILVTRYWPRGLSKERLKISEWIRDLGPSVTLLRAWKAGKISWQEYENRYKEEMTEKQEEIQELARQAAKGMITLLCFEKEQDPHCHRHLLKGMIEAKFRSIHRSSRC